MKKILLSLPIIYTLSGYIGLQYAFKRKEKHFNYTLDIDYQELTLESYDHLKLKGIYIPHQTHKYMICVHGYHSDPIREYHEQIPFLLSLGYNLLLPYDRAHGKSEGKYIGFGYLDRLDIIKWINYIIDRDEKAEIVLYGISMGGATVLNTGGEELPSNVKCIISDCAFSSTNKQLIGELKKKHYPAHLIVSSASLISKRVIGYDIRKANPIKSIQRCTLPILFIHGDNDHYVETEHVYNLYHSYKHDKRLLIVHGATHARSYSTNKQLYEKKVKEFLSYYA